MKFIIAILAMLLPSTVLGAHLNVVVVLDGSGSMGSRFSRSQDKISKMDAAKQSLIQVLSDLPEDTNLGIICFSSNVNGWLVKPGPVNKSDLKTSIMSIKDGGGTPLGKYMKEGANALLELRAKQKSGIYKLIIITDGESSDDVITPLTGRYGILSKGLKIEAIGVDMSTSHTLATSIPYCSAGNEDELKVAVKKVLAESTGAKDHSEDYDLIAPIPPEIALAALQALTEYDNTPVGVKPKNAIEVESKSGIGFWSIFMLIITALLFGFATIALIGWLARGSNV